MLLNCFKMVMIDADADDVAAASAVAAAAAAAAADSTVFLGFAAAAHQNSAGKGKAPQGVFLRSRANEWIKTSSSSSCGRVDAVF